MLPVGYLPCTQDPPDGRNMARVLDEIMAEAQAAEASGWDGCFITEHHQQPDGYLNTYFMFDRERERFTNLKDMHEIYCAGHLFQAAVAHHRATRLAAINRTGRNSFSTARPDMSNLA